MNKSNGISGTGLIIIASVSMTIDHIGVIFFPGMLWLRLIGRIAFPIYAFLIAQGYRHTSNKSKYALRLLLLALVSEIPFDYTFGGGLSFSHQNVFFTLLLGLLVIWAFEKWEKTLWVLPVIFLWAVYYMADSIRCDYSGWGVLLIWLLWKFGDNAKGAAVVIFAMSLVYVLPDVLRISGRDASWLMWAYNTIQFGGVMAIAPIWFYNNKRGASGWPPALRRWFFYLYYPLHLAVLFVVKNF